MCYHNLTQHNGCGHIGESHTQPWKLCFDAIQRLNALRGPNSPPLSPPIIMPNAVPKRSSSTRRFFSLSSTVNTLSRSSTTASRNSRRTVAGPQDGRNPRDSTPNYDLSATLDYSTLPDHQLLAVRCEKPQERTLVSREMDVCKTCKQGIEEMRSMVICYDKNGSIKGTNAFNKFLKAEGDRAELVEDDLTIPLDDNVGGVALGARQAIILGHPETAMDSMIGLEALEREINARKGFY